MRTPPGSYSHQPVQKIGLEYSGHLIQGILNEVDHELMRIRALIDDLGLSSGSGIADANASYITVEGEAGLTSERTLAVGAGMTLTDAGANSSLTVGLDADLVAIAALSTTGFPARTASEAWSLRSFAAGSSRLSITNPAGVAGNPSYDAVMSSTDWDWTRGISVVGTADEIQVDIKGLLSQTASVFRVLSGGDAGVPAQTAGIRMFEVNAVGNVTVSDETQTDNQVRFQVRAPNSQVANIMQVLRNNGTNNYTAFSVGGPGGVVCGDVTTFEPDITRLTINQGSGQSVDMVKLKNSGGVDLIQVDSAGKLIFTSTAGAQPLRIVSGAAAGAVLYGDVDGDAGWTAAGTATQLLHGGAVPSWSAVSLTADVSGTLPIGNGGTGQTTATAAFNALDPLTTLGDILYHNGTDSVRLAGNITATRKFLSQLGDGAASAAPTWEALTAAMLPVHTHASSSQGGDQIDPGVRIRVNGTTNPLLEDSITSNKRGAFDLSGLDLRGLSGRRRRLGLRPHVRRHEAAGKKR